MKQKASIIVPAYNEEEGILKVINSIESILNSMEELTYEIIIVNDGSDDNTSKQVEKENVRLIEHPYNMGYGAALKTGVRESNYDKIAIIDADGTYPVKYLERLLREKDFDMVVGARTGANVHIPILRRPPKWVINKLANYLTGKKIPDLNSGLRVFNKNSLNNFVHLLPDGFSFTTTITLAMVTNNYRINYIQIDYSKRVGKSKIRPIHDTLNFVSLIIKMIIYFKPLKVLLPMAMVLIVADISKIIYDIINYDWHLATSTILLGVIALNTIILGLIADLITTLRSSTLDKNLNQ